MNTKNFKTAPLPFLGQKRRFLKKVNEIIKDHPDGLTYIDLFGGSGLLSHNIKAVKPNSRVIYNDFDNYRVRLQNISNTNALLADIRILVAGLQKDKKMSPEVKKSILERIKRDEASGIFVDYITLSTSLLFSMDYVVSFEELEKATFYNVVRMSDFDATGYLEGVEIVSDDYKVIFEQYRHCPNVVWLVDPPYLSTETKTYSSDGYWKLKDYLDVLKVVEGTNYLYFTSNKSQIVELCEWIESRTITANPFYGSTVTTTSAHVNYAAQYTDILLYKFKPNSK